MELTLKKDINLQSIALQHDILIEATSLLVGREGALETEQLLYLMLAVIDNLSEENVIEECNDDKRELMDIIKEEVEPKFFEYYKEIEGFDEFWLNLKRITLDRCKDIWDKQNSLRGIIEGLVDSLATIDEEGKEKILAATGEVAKQVYEKRTEKMEQATQEVNSKLEELVAKYERAAKEELKEKKKTNKEEETKEEEKIEDNDTE